MRVRGATVMRGKPVMFVAPLAGIVAFIVAGALADGPASGPAVVPAASDRLLIARTREQGAETRRAGDLPEPVADRLRLRRDSIRQVGVFTGSDGRYELYVATNRDGEECLVQITPGLFGNGCSPSLLGRKPAAIAEFRSGGPDAARLTAVRVLGITREDVARLEIVSANGSTRGIEVNPQRSFFYEARRADIAEGGAPAALVAYDAAGRPIARLQLREHG
jgi:hypothetical protein